MNTARLRPPPDERQPDSRSHRALLSGVVATLLALSALAEPPAALAQVGLSISTPFPSVIVQPGGEVSFDLTVSAEEAARVDLSLEGLPEGWSASFSGGGNEVEAVFVTPDAPATVTLNLDVAQDAGGEPVTLTVVGQAADETARLELDLIPAAGAGGAVSMETDAPSIRGTSDQDFTFTVTLNNDTPQELTFNVQATGPQGWQVAAEPSADPQAANLTVAARSSAQIDVTATPPVQATAGTYPIVVEAVSGDYGAATELAAELTGSLELRFTTPDERLSTSATAGSTTDFAVLLVNEGTAPIEAIELSGSGPTGWEITFEPSSVEAIGPGDSVPATAHITPSPDAVAGDYVVTMTASTASLNETMDVRVTVETSPIWALVGIGLIVLTVGGLAWIFRRYGRR